MESFDGAEICDDVVSCLPDKLSSLIGRENNVGLYRDGELTAINGSTGIK